MEYPSRTEWDRFFKRLPRWILALILVMLFGRFVIIGLWHWLFA